MSDCCIICEEVPSAEIFQCVNGHWVCKQCYDKINLCPECRVVYGLNKIRNRALENILNGKQFECPNKPYGCEFSLTRQHLSQHSLVCEFRDLGKTQLELCRSLGFYCSFKASFGRIQAILQHLNDAHSLTLQPISAAILCLKDFVNTESKGAANWMPIALAKGNDKEKAFIVLTKINEVDKTLSIICLLVSANPQSARRYNIKVQVISADPKVLPLEFITSVVSLVDAEKAVQHPMLRIPLSQLNASYLKDDDLEVVVTVIDAIAIGGSSTATKFDLPGTLYATSIRRNKCQIL